MSFFMLAPSFLWASDIFSLIFQISSDCFFELAKTASTINFFSMPILTIPLIISVASLFFSLEENSNKMYQSDFFHNYC